MRKVMSTPRPHVIVRTPAGANGSIEIDPLVTVVGLTDRAVEHFLEREQLEPGSFRLGLLRGATIVDLPPDGVLGGEGVGDGDVLHLITTEPQVDGERWAA
jgi:hypothetical protein